MIPGLLFSGIFLAVTPAYIVPPSFFKFNPNGFGSQVFCRVIGSQYIVFSFGKFSAFIVTFMALERWCAVVKPSRYKTMFTKRRVLAYIISMWFFSFCVHSPVLFEMSVDKETGRCRWVSPGYNKQPLITTSTLVTFFIPMIVTWITYSHIVSTLKASPLAKARQRYLKSKARFVSTCMVVALSLTICWLPNQIYYVLSCYGLVVLETPIHHFTTVLVMLNSCVNPFIYCFSNREYKRALLFVCSSCVKLQRQSRASVDCQTSKGRPKSFYHTAPKDHPQAMFIKVPDMQYQPKHVRNKSVEKA